METFDHKKVAGANRCYYDAVAEKYREYEAYAYSDHIVRDVLRLLKYGSENGPGRSRFLDFGCGSGFLSSLVNDNNFFDYTVGIDISENQVKLYNAPGDQSKNSNDIKRKTGSAIMGDCACMPFKPGSFDMAGCYSVLHHFFDYNSVLGEVAKVLKPGGILYVDFEPNMNFQKLMTLPVKIRRRFFDKAPGNLDELERVAEFHNQVKKGINAHKLSVFLKEHFEILEIGPRFPDFFAVSLFKAMFTINWAFTPYFFLLARKKR